MALSIMFISTVIELIREREKEKGNYNADVKAVVFKNYR